MNIDLDELERKAKAASAKDALSFDEEDFSAYITPEIVCELINRLREAEKRDAELLSALKDIRKWVGDGEFSDDSDIFEDYATPSYKNVVAKVDLAIDAAIAKEQGNG